MINRNKHKLIHCENKEIIIAVIALLVLFLSNFIRLKMVNFDHLAFSNYHFWDSINRNIEFTIIGQSRTNFVNTVTNAIEYLTIDYYWIWTIIYVLVIGLLNGLIVKELISKKIWSFITFILTVILFTISIEPISIPTAYALSLGCGIWTVLISVLFTIRYNKTNLYKYKALAIISMLFTMFTYEVGILYLPVLVGVNVIYTTEFSIKKIFIKSKEFIFVGIIYIICFFIIKLKFPGNYGGNQISDNLNIFSVLKASFFMLIANIPGFFFFYNNSNAYSSPLSYIDNYSDTYLSPGFITSNYLSLSLVIQIILFVYVLHKLKMQLILSSKDNKNNQVYNSLSVFNKILFVGLLIYSIIIPILPSAMTDYTQSQIMDRWRLVVIGNQYSYCFMVITFILIFNKLYKVLKTNRIIFLNMICCVIIIQFAMVAYTNEKNSHMVEIMGTRFEQFDSIIENISNIVGDDAIIVSPSLLNGYGVLSIPEFYYTSRFKFKTGKNINLVAEYDNLDNQENLSNKDIYYLRYIYTTDNNNSLYILAKEDINKLSDIQELKSNSVRVFSFTNNKSFNLIGRVDSEKEEKISIKQYDKEINTITLDMFQVNVIQNKENYGQAYVVDLIGENISVNSIAILPQYNSAPFHSEIVNLKSSKLGNTLSTSKVISGYWDDKWAAIKSEFKIKTGTTGKMKIDTYLPEVRQNFIVSIYIDDEFIENLNIDNNVNNFIIDVPENKEIVLRLEANSDFQSVDGRRLSYLITDIICE